MSRPIQNRHRTKTYSAICLPRVLTKFTSADLKVWRIKTLHLLRLILLKSTCSFSGLILVTQHYKQRAIKNLPRRGALFKPAGLMLSGRGETEARLTFPLRFWLARGSGDPPALTHVRVRQAPCSGAHLMTSRRWLWSASTNMGFGACIQCVHLLVTTQLTHAHSNDKPGSVITNPAQTIPPLLVSFFVCCRCI